MHAQKSLVGKSPFFAKDFVKKREKKNLHFLLKSSFLFLENRPSYHSRGPLQRLYRESFSDRKPKIIFSKPQAKKKRSSVRKNQRRSLRLVRHIH